MTAFTVAASHVLDEDTTLHIEVQSADGHVPESQLQHRLGLAVKAALDAAMPARTEVAESLAPGIDLDRLHPDDAAMARHFRYDHLPPHLAAVSRQFHDLAAAMFNLLPPESVELSQMVDHLLAAKDWAVRGVVTATEDEVAQPDENQTADCADCGETVDRFTQYRFRVTADPRVPPNVILLHNPGR